jgi:hypothetical protein
MHHLQDTRLLPEVMEDMRPTIRPDRPLSRTTIQVVVMLAVMPSRNPLLTVHRLGLHQGFRHPLVLLLGKGILHPAAMISNTVAEDGKGIDEEP